MTEAFLHRRHPAARLRSGAIAFFLVLLTGIGLASGIGGTGRPAIEHEGSGIGGTGYPLPHSEGSGIGGTGRPVVLREGSGIGGTGIVGIITGFGSIWVNGIEVHFGDDAVVATPNGPRSPEDLAIGQLVLVASEQQGDRTQARNIQLLPAVAGPVTAAHPGENRYVIAGQTVQFGKSLAALPAPRVGDWLTVSGLRRSDDTIMASSATPYPRSAPVLVYGPLSTGEDNGLRIQGLPVTLPPGTTDVPSGSHVLISGTIEGDRLVAREIHDNPVGRLAAEADTVSLQGYVQASREDELRIASVAVRFSQVPRPAMPAPGVDQLVQVEAYHDEEGILRIDHIETLPGEILGLDSLEPESHQEGGTAQESEASASDDRESESPSLETSETENPELESAEQETPEVETPETETPEVESPEVESPEVETPEVETPETEVPEVETPEVETPEVETPEVEVPEVEAPEVEVPEVEIPESEPPEIGSLDAPPTPLLLVESSQRDSHSDSQFPEATVTQTTPCLFGCISMHLQAPRQSHLPRRS